MKIRKIYDRLDSLSPEDIIFLEYKNPFQLLIGVILSAQTTDRQVNSISPQLFARFPDAEALGAADPAEVEEIIRPVGFFRAKASSIIKTSAMIRDVYKGRIPDTIEELIKLPGVGRKSANVITGACYGKPAVIVDTHFSRTVTRLGLTSEKNPEKIEKDLAEKIPKEIQYRFSMLLNKLGREYCRARKPDCALCPVNEYCEWTDITPRQ